MKCNNTWKRRKGRKIVTSRWWFRWWSHWAKHFCPI